MKIFTIEVNGEIFYFLLFILAKKFHDWYLKYWVFSIWAAFVNITHREKCFWLSKSVFDPVQKIENGKVTFIHEHSQSFSKITQSISQRILLVTEVEFTRYAFFTLYIVL